VCDLFSVDSLASALVSEKRRVILWIEQGGSRRLFLARQAKSYTSRPITDELVTSSIMRVFSAGFPNQALFEAYVQYCFAPIHTVGEHCSMFGGTSASGGVRGGSWGRDFRRGKEEEATKTMRPMINARRRDGVIRCRCRQSRVPGGMKMSLLW